MRFKAKLKKNPKAFKDYFSSQADQYAINRPKYPEKLYRYLIGECRGRKLAWDVGTGNGQAANGLSRFFEKVYATDASSSQILNAIPKSNITYAVANEQAPALKRQSVDLITVAQSLHWFDIEVFFAEASRVLKRYGLVACWSYNLFRIDKEVDSEIDNIYGKILDGYWGPERRLVETRYRTLSFPFRELRAPRFEIKLEWNFGKMLGYLRSWSAVKNYKKRVGHDPISQEKDRLKSAWGDPEEIKELKWPISMRVGYVF